MQMNETPNANVMLDRSHHKILDFLSNANAAFVSHTAMVNQVLAQAATLQKENDALKAEIEKLKEINFQPNI